MLGRPRLYAAARRGLGVMRYAARRPHDQDFRWFAALADLDGLFLDIGANSGASALSYHLFDPGARILSLEPNPAHRPDLVLTGRLLRGKFGFRIVAAGEQKEELVLHVPVHRGIQLTGEASLLGDGTGDNWTAEQIGIDPAEITIEEVRVPVITIDSLGLQPKAVKIDVEGAELMVLRGMRQTIERARPVLLIEPTVGVAAIVEELGQHGYSAHVFHPGLNELQPYVAGATEANNVFFLPPAELSPPGGSRAATGSSQSP